MFSIELNMYQAVAVAAIVLLLGRVLTGLFPVLKKYCIPEPVVGGVVYALVHVILRSAGILEISFDATLQNFFMTVFFCSVGFTACFRLLKKGGIQVFLFLGLAVLMVILQNVLGSALAAAFHLDPRLGLATGSIPMVGGHGTAGAFGPVLETAGVTGAHAVAIASATFGLVAGCVIGGPIAYRRIHSLNLHSTESATGSNEVVVDKNEVTGAIDSRRFLDASLYLAIAIGAGTVVSSLLQKITIMGQPMSFPSYIGAMVVAAAIRNVMDVHEKDVPMEEISTIGSFSLSLFLRPRHDGLKALAACRAGSPDGCHAGRTDGSDGILRLFHRLHASWQKLRCRRHDDRLLRFRNGRDAKCHGKHAGRDFQIRPVPDGIFRRAAGWQPVRSTLSTAS